MKQVACVTRSRPRKENAHLQRTPGAAVDDHGRRAGDFGAPDSSCWHGTSAGAGSARLIVGRGAGESRTRAAHEPRLRRQTVGRWRIHFLTTRLDGLLEEPRPGGPRTVADATWRQC
jgi:hypothetical protein